MEFQLTSASSSCSLASSSSEGESLPDSLSLDVELSDPDSATILGGCGATGLTEKNYGSSLDSIEAGYTPALPAFSDFLAAGFFATG
jgi:hypothetical protein